MLRFYKVVPANGSAVGIPVEIHENAFPPALRNEQPTFSFHPSETVRDLARAFAIHCAGKIPAGRAVVYWCVSRAGNKAEGWLV